METERYALKTRKKLVLLKIYQMVKLATPICPHTLYAGHHFTTTLESVSAGFPAYLFLWEAIEPLQVLGGTMIPPLDPE
jgi:hypothetical protein